MRWMSIQEWAKAEFSESARPSKNTLRAWAKSRQIDPPAQQIAGKWCVLEGAKYRPTRSTTSDSTMSERARRILNGTATA